MPGGVCPAVRKISAIAAAHFRRKRFRRRQQARALDRSRTGVCADNSGTPSPKGRAWRKSIYGSVGVLASKQQAAALRSLAAARPWIDLSRVAVWGWSGGGSMTDNLMFRSPGLYKIGVSVAAAPDQTLYDTIYQERYMGLPAANAKGYHNGSPIHFAEGLRGKLLIIHGTGDDNVHFQGNQKLMNRLVELGKQFDFMEYPNRNHGLTEGRGTLLHVYTFDCSLPDRASSAGREIGLRITA